jgi:replicative DNA helicase
MNNSNLQLLKNNDRETEMFAREQYLEKPLPSAPEAEKCVIGGILLDNKLMVQALSILSVADFYSPIHRNIFDAMVKIHKSNMTAGQGVRLRSIDPIQIAEEMKKTGSVESMGGIAAITNLTYGLPHFDDIAQYCEIVKEKSEIRGVIKLCNEITSDALSEEMSPAELKAKFAPRLKLVGDSRLTKPKKAAQVWETVKGRFAEWKDDQKVFAVPTGIPELNATLRLNGFAPRDLVFVAARPSIGKTALMLTFTQQAALMRMNPLDFTLEMSEDDLFMRLLPAISGVKNFSINPTTLRKNPEAARRLYMAGDFLAKLPFQFESDCFSLDKLIAKAENAVQTDGVRIVFLDYLQLLRATTGDGSTAYGQRRRRDQELEEISRELKGLAKRCDIPVVCLAQLNRAVEYENRRPESSDIREAGASEQDADLIILPYRTKSRRKELEGGNGHRKGKKSFGDIVDQLVEKYDDEPEDESLVDVSLYISKQRNGRSNVEVPVQFDMDYQRFMTATLWDEDRLDKLQ